MQSAWPPWAIHLIAQCGCYYGASTTCVSLPGSVYDYVVSRMRREYLDAMLDAEIGQ